MPVVVEQNPEMAAGHARLKLMNAGDLDPATVEVAVSASIDGVEKHLDPSRQGPAAWAAGENWFRPAEAARQGGALSLEFGPAATWHLKPYQPYQIGFRDAAGHRADDRMSWIAMRLPSNPPPPAPERPAAQPEPAPELAAFAELEANAGDAIIEPARPDEEDGRAGRRTGLYVIIGALLILLLIAAALLWYFREDVFGPASEEVTRTEETRPEAPAPDGSAPATPEQAPARIPLTLDAARSYLIEEKPAAEDAQAEAERFDSAGEVQAAFILRKYAAQKGSSEAALAMARQYDPATHDPDAGVIAEPDATIAADWYERAAEGGNVDAMVRLGEMLKSGALDRPDAPEQSVFWLRKAAEADSEKAKELLQ
ncbi:MAG: hypothetical protein TEF_12065 [Rhizobiales bacterium NRL2]|jgi:hypothetical protein|nr:MAG: hypothetical protein TEF_12065 [Rhizobiales bacterium NRL2]